MEKRENMSSLEIAREGLVKAIQLGRGVEEESPTDRGSIIEEVAAALEAKDLGTLRRYRDPHNGFPYYTNIQMYLHELELEGLQ